MHHAISLFSGIGGLDIGFSAAGFDIIAQIEIETFCQRVLKRHAPEWWPNAAILPDVCKFGIASLPGIKPGEIAAIFGGFPCQDISAAGNGAGIRNGERSGLWYEFARIIGEFRPRTVLLENVARIVSPGKEDGKIQSADALMVISALAEMGYNTRWGIISAADTGAPHLRERWWCMAYDNSQRRQMQTTRNTTSDTKWDNSAYQREGRTELHALVPSGTDLRTATVGDTEIQGLSGRECRSTKVYRQSVQTETSRIADRFNRSNSIIRRRKEYKSRMGRNVHGIPAWLDKPRWAAGHGNFQYDYEPPRTIGKGIDKNRAARIAALGNAVLPQIAFALACEIMNLCVK